MPNRIFHHEDFASVNIQISLRNKVSETLIDSKSKTIAGILTENSSKSEQSNLIELLEIFPTGFILSVPSYTCSVGHHLEIKFHVTHLSKNPIELFVIGAVKTSEKTSWDQVRIEVELKSDSHRAWEEFCILYQARQEAILEFFKSVKGYG